MKVKELRGTSLAKIICSIAGADGITLYPFILYKSKYPSKTLVTHEHVHVGQIKKLGVFRFYTSYLLEYFSYRVRGDSQMVAYNRISYEKEAYAKEKL
jgi:hypothetical protein